jgi:hypothetical protein
LINNKDEVLHFISTFKGSEHTFLNGNCFWFAHILNSRFGGYIVYDVIDDHFYTEIDNIFYDIKGIEEINVDEKSIFYWSKIYEYDSNVFNRINRDDILHIQDKKSLYKNV